MLNSITVTINHVRPEGDEQELNSTSFLFTVKPGDWKNVERIYKEVCHKLEFEERMSESSK